MNINEFSIACKLINLKLRGFDIPQILPPTLIASLSSAAGTPTLTPTGSLSPLDPLKSLSNNITTIPTSIPLATAIKQPQVTSVPQGIIPPLSGPPAIPPVGVSGGIPLGIVASTSITPQIISAQQAPMQAGIVGINSQQAPLVPGQISLTQPIIPGVQPLVSVPPLIPPTATTAPIMTSLIGVPTTGVIPPTVTPAVASTVPLSTTEPPAPPTPPQSNPPSRNMSISERGLSMESP